MVPNSTANGTHWLRQGPCLTPSPSGWDTAGKSGNPRGWEGTNARQEGVKAWPRSLSLLLLFSKGSVTASSAEDRSQQTTTFRNRKFFLTADFNASDDIHLTHGNTGL